MTLYQLQKLEILYEKTSNIALSRVKYIVYK